MDIRKGDIYYADLTPVIGCEQGGVRPVLIIQNDVGNCYSPTVIAAAITSRLDKHMLPTHVPLKCGCLRRDSVALLEQVRTIDRSRLRKYIGQMDAGRLQAVDQALAVSFGMECSRYTADMQLKGKKKSIRIKGNQNREEKDYGTGKKSMGLLPY